MDRAVSVAGLGPGALISRRLLLQGSGAAFAALLLGEGFNAVQAAATAPAAVGLRRSDYMPFIGRRFGLAAPGGRLSVPLVAVEDMRAPRRLAGSQDAFTLVFHAPPGSVALGQAVMTVSHPRGFSQRLLVTPAGTGRRGQDYAVVINRANLD
jgi:hypothetical protein